MSENQNQNQSGSGLSSFDITNLILSIVGALLTVQQVHSYVHNKLPTQQLKKLDSTIEDTVDFFQSVIEEGVFGIDSKFVQDTEADLQKICRRRETCRAKTHSSITYLDQLRGLFNGLCSEMNRHSAQVTAIRTKIAAARELELRTNAKHSPSSSVHVPRYRTHGPSSLPQGQTSGLSGVTPPRRGWRLQPRNQRYQAPSGITSRHPILGNYLLQDDGIFETLQGHASALREQPRSHDQAHGMQIMAGNETLQLSFSVPDQASAIGGSMERTTSLHADPDPHLSPVVAGDVDPVEEYTAALEALRQNVALLSAVADPVIKGSPLVGSSSS